MQAWILRILCAAALSVLAEMLLPSGKLKKFVSLAAGLALMIVIVSPLGALIKERSQQAFNFDSGQSVTVDALQLRKKAEMDVLAILSSYEGYEQASVHIDIDENKSKVSGVHITVPKQKLSIALVTLQMRDSAVKGVFSALYQIKDSQVEIIREE